MSDKQTTALVLFLFFALALFLNNSASANVPGTSKLAEIIGILKGQYPGGSTGSGLPQGTSGLPKATPQGTGIGAGGIPTGLPPLWPQPTETLPGTVDLPDGYYYSPGFVTDLDAYLKSQRQRGIKP
jgi:hypothetical protein